MSAAPEVINPQIVTEISLCRSGVHLSRKDIEKGSLPTKLSSGDASSSSDELNTKTSCQVRKPYTITKQRERWTEIEHDKFLEALKLYGRAWRRVEEYIGTKTAVQIRSHAQKFFHKLEREASCGSSGGKLPDIAIPPPRPKRKPNHPYPKKAGSSPPVLEDESKENLLLSSPGISAGHVEGFPFGSFNPCMSQGLGTACKSPVAGRHFFRPQGSAKIFGKSVSVTKTNKAGFHDCASLVSGDKADGVKRKQIMGFSPFVKVKNLGSDSFSRVDRNSSYSGAAYSEASELLKRSCEHDLAEVLTDAADSVTPCDGDSKITCDLGKGESGSLAAGPKEGKKGDMHFFHLMNPPRHSWTNFIPYQSGISILPIPGSGVVDRPSNNPLSYCQFIQASAVNYATYTAALAAAGREAANPTGTDSTVSLKGRMNDVQLPSVPLPWWAYSRFMPPVSFPLPMDASQQGVDLDTSNTAKSLSSEMKLGSLRVTTPQKGEPYTCSKGTEVSEICEPALNVGGVSDCEIPECKKINGSTQISSTFQTSCLTEASEFADVYPISDSLLDAQGMFMPAKLHMQGSDTEIRVNPGSPKNAYSSSDEFEVRGKKQGEGSSSGSNTSATRGQSSEGDAPSIVESKKSDCCTFSADNEDSWSRGLQTSHQRCVTDTAELPKLRLKHSDKSRKHQQRDPWHGDDSKRFKSCAHEMELRKEVSQEGRKAFQALFTSKLLPQTFPVAGDREFSGKGEHVSTPIVAKNEFRLSECIKFRVPQENVNKGGDLSNNLEILGMGNEFQGLDGNPEVTRSKGFAVSPSSGFVPYRRLACPEPSTICQPSSLQRKVLNGRSLPFICTAPTMEAEFGLVFFPCIVEW
ncbi:hypothetical protein L7F22_058941 [Adiantum nelumboides]|nr:hypothetical protein [Adiantum nelumboides]